MSERNLFESALEIADLQARQAFLDQACQGDVDLRAKVDALLESHATAGSFLDIPAADQMGPWADGITTKTFVGAPSSHQDESEDEQIDLSFLQPSTKPGSLGTLAHYEIVQVLGQGAFGVVFKAFDEKLHRLVAIKVMSAQMAATSPARKRFLREARSAAAIKQENVVQVYSVEEHPLPYLVMEYISGETLQQRLDATGPLDVQEVLDFGHQIACGLAAAHAKGLIHRDIKPGNILLEHGVKQTVKITDFGLARAADDASLTRSGFISGTPMYMAPEQALGHAQDHRSDLFSLGSVLYQVACGRPPFRAATTIAVLRRVVEESPRSMQEILPEIPDWLVAIVNKLQAKNPDERFQSAKELADLLDHCKAELRLGGKVTSVDGLDIPASAGSAEQTPKKTALKKPPRSKTGIEKRRLVLIGVIVLGIVIFAVIIGSLRTKNGTLIVEVDQPDAIVQVWDAAGKIEITRSAEPGTTSMSLEPGMHRLHVEKAGFAVFGQEFEMQTRGTKTLTAKMVPLENKPAVTVKTWHDWPPDAPPPAISPFNANQAKQHQAAWAKYLKVDVECTNSLGMKFVLIPPGEFTMGSTAAEIEATLKDIAPNDTRWQECVNSEAPQHKVILTQPIYLGVNEVTQAEYEKVMGTNPSHFAPTGMGKEAVAGMETTQHPVETVSWNDAAEFCAKLSTQEKLKPSYFRAGDTVTPFAGTGYRLPTEAEWEFACRAGTTTKFWIGDPDEALVQAGWFGANSGGRTHAAGELKVNPFGLYDIHGNVWEWVEDGWDATYYGQFREKPAINPHNPFFASSQRVMRGGRWIDSPSFCRSSFRHATRPTYFASVIGFRVSLVVVHPSVSR